MKQIAGRILVGLVGLALLGWILGYLAYGGGHSSEEAKAQFVTELRQFDAFEAHRALLLDTVERKHEEVFQSNQRRQQGHSKTSLSAVNSSRVDSSQCGHAKMTFMVAGSLNLFNSRAPCRLSGTL